MESPSLSRSLVNKNFEDWCAKLAASDDLKNAALMTNMNYTPEHWVELVIKASTLDWMLIPFITWDSKEPTWVKVRTAQGHENKGTLRLSYGYGQIRIYFKEKAGNRAEYPVKGDLILVRYRFCRSKRWRSPKDCHQTQQAYYMLKYGS